MDEQISEEFAKEFLLKMPPDTWFDFFETKNEEIIINYWKQKGYIKQSREEEIKSRLKNLFKEYDVSDKNIFEIITLQKELIAILDKKIGVNT
jgi:F0F1-type ATP synthase alpha subunit